MKRFIGIAVFVVLFSTPAIAQNKTANSASSNSSNGGGSGGSGGGGGSSSSSGRLPAYPAARFSVNAVSGTDAAFSPSIFLSYDKAVAAGKTSAPRKKSVAEIAEESNGTQKAKARVVFVQDARGHIVSVPR